MRSADWTVSKGQSRKTQGHARWTKQVLELRLLGRCLPAGRGPLRVLADGEYAGGQVAVATVTDNDNDDAVAFLAGYLQGRMHGAAR